MRCANAHTWKVQQGMHILVAGACLALRSLSNMWTCHFDSSRSSQKVGEWSELTSVTMMALSCHFWGQMPLCWLNVIVRPSQSRLVHVLTPLLTTCPLTSPHESREASWTSPALAQNHSAWKRRKLTCRRFGSYNLGYYGIDLHSKKNWICKPYLFYK